MALFGSVSTALMTANTTFSGNTAGIAGSAVYVSGVVVRPKFVGTRFVSNSAGMGGGVYTKGTGIAEEPDSLDVPESQDPFSFPDCEFVVNITFVGNTAGSGGALRLAGEASL